MIDHLLHERLDEFLRQPDRNRWLCGEFLEVYLRKTRRRLSPGTATDINGWRDHSINCIDFANMKDMRPEHQLQGIFPGFFDQLETKPFAIYVELVGPTQLQWYFDRRGYVRIPGINVNYHRLSAR